MSAPFFPYWGNFSWLRLKSRGLRLGFLLSLVAGELLFVSFMAFTPANLLGQKLPWQLDKGSLAPYYQNPDKWRGQSVTLVLRLANFDEKRKRLLFYDQKGNPLLLGADQLFYNDITLTLYRNLAESVRYRVEFVVRGLRNKKLTGDFLSLERVGIDQL